MSTSPPPQPSEIDPNFTPTIETPQLNNRVIAQRLRRARERTQRQHKGKALEIQTHASITQVFSLTSQGGVPTQGSPPPIIECITDNRCTTQRTRRGREPLTPAEKGKSPALPTNVEDEEMINFLNYVPSRSLRIGEPRDIPYIQPSHQTTTDFIYENRVIAQRLRRARERTQRQDKGNPLEIQPNACQTKGDVPIQPLPATTVECITETHLQRERLTHGGNEISTTIPTNDRVIAQRLRRARERTQQQGKGNTFEVHTDLCQTRGNIPILPSPPTTFQCTDEAATSSSHAVRASKRARVHSLQPEQPPQSESVFMEECNALPQPSSPSSSQTNYASTVSVDRHYLGLMEFICRDCHALHWIDERLQKSSPTCPLFGTCCLQGKIRLPPLIEPPLPLKSLYDGVDSLSTSFRAHIRRFNAANAFTSLGATLEPRVLNGRGPNSFTIHGELRHRTGSLLPEDGTEPSYAQLYVYDPSYALRIRSSRNVELDIRVLKIIQDTLLQYNVFYPIYKQARAILSHLNPSNEHLPVFLHYNPATDRRIYNLPTSNEIAILMPGDGTESTTSRDIVLHLKGSRELLRISECHPAYLPLHYVLLFPYGELGWDPELKQWDTKNNRISKTRLTQMQFYSYRLFQRPNEYSTILKACNLFQEFLVDAWASTEQNRLTYIRQNQSRLRSELYNGLTDISADGLRPDQVGRRFILPSSFTGSSRHLFQIYQDSMAITRYHHHPDIFITMTANPKWPEITSALLPNQTVVDRPDLVTRVFELKRKKLMHTIQKDSIFGKVVAHVFTIEFQKRGLPHMHALIFLQQSDKIHKPDQIDCFVSAEFPSEDEDPLLFETVKNCMVHGPCGQQRVISPCMIDGKCSKGYPRSFVHTTTLAEDGYPTYRRRNDGRVFTVRGHLVDNRNVVPYNPHLSKLFNCHINVEICASVRCVKYIHKYIYKGDDRATVVVGEKDEIQQYLDSRYIAPPEAAWRLFGYLLHEENPNVVRLAVHLPGMHSIVFNPACEVGVIQYQADQQMSTLMAFFFRCGMDATARNYTYQEFPEHYVWDKESKLWYKRKKGFAIGRMYFVRPNAGERFYLRLLLTVVTGPSSFESLRTFNGVLYDTFRAACVSRGLLEDDGEYIKCLEEAITMNTGGQLRRLFSIILLECNPVNPHVLWDNYAPKICDDIAHQLRTKRGVANPTNAQILDLGLHFLNELLLESGKNLKDDFPTMPQPHEQWDQILGNRLIWEHIQLKNSVDVSVLASNVNQLNGAQRSAYETIMKSVTDDDGVLFFLNGGAGTGKTYLYNTVAGSCRINGNIVITVASSGIASLLLAGGRTAHSTFRIPLDVHEDSICNIGKQTPLAELLRQTKLIIWDEVPMQHRYCVEAVNRTLQDILDNSKPFGGITVVLGGDFRQILPVIPKGVREQVVCASLRRSSLWNQIKVLTLSENMRLDSNDHCSQAFRNFLQEVGANSSEQLQLPSSINKCTSVSQLISAIYPTLGVYDTVSTEYLTERTILSARNEDVSTINTEALNIFPGEVFTYLAADKMPETEDNNYSLNTQCPNEFLSSLNPSGFPPFNLELKIGCPIMLLRNLSPKNGLCNGTRLMVVRCASRVIEAKILNGDKVGNLVFIPRISLTPHSSDLGIQFTRRQFPIRLAYGMTINKSQGQSVKYVGLDLRFPVFSHGQLYVALSRCTSSSRVHVLLPEQTNTFSTTNVVYNEVLL